MSRLRLLVAESETPDEREKRRQSAGRSAGESYAATLRGLEPQAEVEIIAPADSEDAAPGIDGLRGYDAVFLGGSPLHVYQDRPEVRRQLAFMARVFDAGVPSFGSCAGLQVAVAAAGGTVRPMEKRREVGIARRLTRTDDGADHPLFAGRPAAWDAPTVHGDEVERLPDGARLLASNSACRVQAVEIRHGDGLFWGVQTHPELAPGEIAAALRRQKDSLIEAELVDDEAGVEAQAAWLDRLHRDPDDPAARWALGVDDEFAAEPKRRRELVNFLAMAKSR